MTPASGGDISSDAEVVVVDVVVGVDAKRDGEVGNRIRPKPTIDEEGNLSIEYLV